MHYDMLGRLLFRDVELAGQLMDEIIAVLGILLMILIPMFGFFYNRNRKLRVYYKILCKKSSSLKPTEVLGLRGESKYGFNKYYYPRGEDKIIKRKIEENENVLIIGNPMTGKSRAIFQVLSTSKNIFNVIIPRIVDVKLEDFRIPFCFRFWRRNIVILDDLDKFLERQNSMYLFHEFLGRNAIIVASCRSGPEYTHARTLSDKFGADFYSMFGDPVRIGRITRKEAEKVAEKAGKNLPSTFDGNIGSIFLQIESMKERFRSCSGEEKGILRSMKRLYDAGIYSENVIFSLEIVKRVCKEKEGIEKKHYEWVELLAELQAKGFIEMTNNEVWADEAYLEFVVAGDFSSLRDLNEMLTIFSKSPYALSKIGKRARDFKGTVVQKPKYLRLAIEAFEKTQKFHSLEKSPFLHFSTMIDLGLAYSDLAKVEDTVEDRSRAIKAFEEALKAITTKEFQAFRKRNPEAMDAWISELRGMIRDSKKLIEIMRAKRKLLRHKAKLEREKAELERKLADQQRKKTLK